jgi:hypothetical protein
MKNIKYLLLTLFAFALSCSGVFAQGQQPPPGFGNWQNMDPQQMQQMIQQRMMDGFRDQLAVTNDDEWGIIQPRLSKVVRLRIDMFSGGGMGMMRRNGGNGGPGGGFRGFGTPDPNAESLQNAIDNGAPAAQIKAALEKYRDSRKQKQADLARAQDDLRSVLTLKQEAALVLAGMLE